MSRKVLVPIIVLVFIMASMAMAVDKPKPTPIIDPQPVGPPLTTDACTMIKTNGTAGAYYDYWVPGDGNVTFWDPAVECAAVPPIYPFEIISLSVTLYDFVGAVWPVDVDFVVYDMADPSDYCAGPGAELCRETFSCDQAGFMYPAVGVLTFSDPCCVNGPVYIGLEYPGSTNSPYPSLTWDTTVPTCCEHWFNMGGWYDWCWAFGDPPLYGGPIYWVDGETNSANCPDDEWPNHKMHFPQLPDPTGWDVNASAPLSLADDWQCSETGWVKDLHFWGSWRSDDIGFIDFFTITIHSNNPQGPGGYSIPDAPLWGPVDIAEFEIVDMEPSSQGWYDPASGEVVPDEHQQYFRYDIILPEALWFYQTINEIYWLRITAHVQDPGATQWGWKNTQDHFMDDAVWAPDPFDPFPPWVELYEPGGGDPPDPIVNGYMIALGPAGEFLDGFGEDAYTTPENPSGWYYYPNSEWWNVWFYDHPFDPTRMKEFFIMANIWPLEPGPAYVEIAINWSTPAWPPEWPPPVPPLEDPQYPEEEVIGRESFYIFQGEIIPGEPVVYNFVIPDYNPEWVSVDVRGYNFVIDGVIEHTCMLQGGQEQSLDLAFVITGEPDTEDPVYDLWETPADHNTFVDFGCPAIPPVPADFFGPGSDPFDGIIALMGEPLPTAPADVLGPTDTIVKRSRAASFPSCPSTDDPIETEIVALNLVSTVPITVTYGGMDPEEWDVKVCLSEVEPQPVGFTYFSWDCLEGGTFAAEMYVLPKFIFTRISDGTQYSLDFGAHGIAPIEYNTESYWQFIDSFFDVYVSPPEGVLASNCDDNPDIFVGPSAVDLIPGLQADPCNDCYNASADHLIPITSLIEPGGCAQHDIWPPHDTAEPIPTLSEWGMILLALLLLASGTVAVIRRRRTADAR